MRNRLARIRRMRGVAAVEFALVAIPMALLLSGIVDFGYAFFQYNTLVKSTRDAVRLLSTYSPTSSDYPLSAAKCYAVYGNGSCTGSPLAPGLTTAMVVVCDPVNTSGCAGTYQNVQTDPSGDTINLVQVKITGFAFTQLVGFFQISNLVFGDISCVMRQVS